MRPHLADPVNKPAPADIMQTDAHLQEMLAIRKSSPLFRLGDKQAVIDRLTFYNTGPNQLRGLIVMSLSDKVDANIDPNYASIVVLFNANDEPQTFTDPAFTGLNLQLHPIQTSSADPIVKTATFNSSAGTFTIPARTTAVFVEAE
jgi:pullulanase/glycogen debranching enzyme